MVSTLEMINHSQIDLLNNQPIFLAWLTSAQSIASSTASTPIASVPKVSWPAPQVDTYSGWSSLNPTIYTPKLAGYYLIVAQVAFNNNSSGSRIVNISFNGGAGSQTIGQVTQAPQSDGFYDSVLNCSGVQFFNGTTDYVTIATYQGTGSNLNLNSPQTKLYISRIHI